MHISLGLRQAQHLFTRAKKKITSAAHYCTFDEESHISVKIKN